MEENQQPSKKSNRGGPRPNSGGYRPGSGRKKKPPTIIDVEVNQPKPTQADANRASAAAQSIADELPDTVSLIETVDPLLFLKAVIAHQKIDVKLRIEAAKAALPFTTARVADAGKKEEKAKRAKDAGNKFAPSQPPPLRAVGGRA